MRRCVICDSTDESVRRTALLREKLCQECRDVITETTKEDFEQNSLTSWETTQTTLPVAHGRPRNNKVTLKQPDFDLHKGDET